MSYNNKQDIRSFYNVAQSRDFHRDFLFRVAHIELPGMSWSDDELVYVKAGEVPARSITNIPTPYMGLEFNVPGNATYPGSDAYALKFYLDAGSNLREKLEIASRTVFNDIYSQGQYNTPTTEHYIELQQLDKALLPIATYKLYGASIREISPVGYDMASGNGGTVELDATISYHYYELEEEGGVGSLDQPVGAPIRNDNAGADRFGNVAG